MALPPEATALMNALNDLNTAASPAQLASLSRRVTRAADDLELVCEETSDTAQFKQLSSYITRAREAVKSARLKARQAALKADRNALIQPPPQTDQPAEQGTAARLAAEINDALRRTAAVVGEEIQRSNVAGDVVEESTRRLKLTRNQHVTYGESVTSGQSTLKSIRRTELFANFVVVLCFALFFVAAAYVANRRLQNSNINAFIVRPTVKIASTPFRITAWLFRTAFSAPDSQYDNSPPHSDVDTSQHDLRTSAPPVKEKPSGMQPPPPATGYPQPEGNAPVSESKAQQSQPSTTVDYKPPATQPDIGQSADTEEVSDQPSQQRGLEKQSSQQSESAPTQDDLEIRTATDVVGAHGDQPGFKPTAKTEAQDHHGRLSSSESSAPERPEQKRLDAAESELHKAAYHERESRDAKAPESEQVTLSERQSSQSAIEADVVNESEQLPRHHEAAPSDTAADDLYTPHLDVEKEDEVAAADDVTDSSEDILLDNSGTGEQDKEAKDGIVHEIQSDTSEGGEAADIGTKPELLEVNQDEVVRSTKSDDGVDARTPDDDVFLGETEDTAGKVEFHEVDSGDVVDVDEDSELYEGDEDIQRETILSTEEEDGLTPAAHSRNLSEALGTEDGAGDYTPDMTDDERDSNISEGDTGAHRETTKATYNGSTNAPAGTDVQRQPFDTEGTTGDHEVESEEVPDIVSDDPGLLDADGEERVVDLQSASDDESLVREDEAGIDEAVDTGEDANNDDVDVVHTNITTSSSSDGDDMIIAEESSQREVSDTEGDATVHEDMQAELAVDGEDLLDTEPDAKSDDANILTSAWASTREDALDAKDDAEVDDVDKKSDDADILTSAWSSTQDGALDAKDDAEVDDVDKGEAVNDEDYTEQLAADSDGSTGATQPTANDDPRTLSEDESPTPPHHSAERGEDHGPKHSGHDAAEQCSTNSEFGSCKATLDHGVRNDQRGTSICRRVDVCCNFLKLPSCLRTSLTPVTV